MRFITGHLRSVGLSSPQWAENPILCILTIGGPQVKSAFRLLVACRVGRKLEWDAENLKAPNCPEADRHIRKEYRQGWVLNG